VNFYEIENIQFFPEVRIEHVRKLSISYCNDALPNTIGKYVRLFPKITSLQLGMGFFDIPLEWKIEELIIDSARNFVRKLGELHLENLKKIHIKSSEDNAEGLHSIISQFLLNHPNITELSLCLELKEGLKIIDLETLEEILKTLKNLKKLKIETEYEDFDSATVKTSQLIAEHGRKLESFEMNFGFRWDSWMRTPEQTSIKLMIEEYFKCALPNLQFMLNK
jgi:hypothetical protein